MTLPGVTTLNVYALKTTADDFVLAVRALADRVEAEGESGVLSYRFYVDEARGIGRAVVDYRDAAAWIGHHDISMVWPEMKALHVAAKLEDVTFLGPFAQEIRDWLAGSALTATLQTGFASVAGFARVGK